MCHNIIINCNCRICSKQMANQNILMSVCDRVIRTKIVQHNYICRGARSWNGCIERRYIFTRQLSMIVYAWSVLRAEISKHSKDMSVQVSPSSSMYARKLNRDLQKIKLMNVFSNYGVPVLWFLWNLCSGIAPNYRATDLTVAGRGSWASYESELERHSVQVDICDTTYFPMEFRKNISS